MYFAVLPGYFDDQNKWQINKEKSIKNFLNNKISEVERITDEWNENIKYYHLSLKNLRKLKIQSLTDDKIKIKLTKLETLLNDKTKINIYGDKKPMFGTSGTGSTGTSGTSGSSGIMQRGFYKGDKYNRFAQKPRKNFDFHKMKNKNLRKV